MRIRTWLLAVTLVVLSASACAQADGPGEASAEPLAGVSGPAMPLADPADVGMSAAALDRIVPAMQEFIDEGRLPGIMTMVARGGQIVHWETVGMRDREAGDPLERDDVFRIFSMTKPVTSTAIMMLVESGDISLDDPVSRFIPAFADAGVYRDGGEPTPVSSPITIQHLLSHNGGLTYGVFGDTPVDRMYLQSGLFQATSLEEYVSIVAGLPLVAEPGEMWNYSVSTDVLGRVVEVASGQSFADFLEERIFAPLEMDDTAFWVPAGNLDRFTARYSMGENGLEVVDSPFESPYTEVPAVASGGGGLASTASDYIRFAHMLLQDGELDGVRILQPETVRAMRTNVLPEELTPISVANWFSPGYGFGLGFATLVDDQATPEDDNDGVFRWGGVANTFFWIDPEADMIAMVWTQMDPFLVYGLERQFQELVYAAIED